MPTRKPRTRRLKPEATKDLRAQLAEIIRENRYLGEQHVTVEQQISNLATLYVALNSLHKAHDLTGVVSSIHEIVANLIGSEEMGIFETDAARKRLTLLTSIGIDANRYKTVRIGDGPIGAAASTGELVIKSEGDAEGPGGDSPIACIPLKLDGQVAGVLVIFGLLPQKSALDDVDFDLFDVLATHAATALTFARLYSETGAPGAHA
jgi:GAF domain-containing protein